MRQARPSSLSTVFAAFAGVLGLTLSAAHANAQAGEPLTLVQTIALPDVRGRIDHLDIDLDAGRLFVAALGNDTVEVIDLHTGRRTARIVHLRKPQGVAYVPDAGRLFVANGEGGRVDIFAGPELSPIAHIDSLPDADNIRYDRVSGQIYVGYGDGALAVLDSSTLRKTADIKLAGHPESFQLDSKGSRLYVNVPGARQIAVVDTQKGVVEATWDLAGMHGNFPLALDEVSRRVFVATRRPAALVVYDAVSGKRTANVPSCVDADDVFFDSRAKRLYVICGEGVVDVVRQQDADHYQVIGHLQTAQGARTGLFVPAQRSLYVAVPARPSAAAEMRVYQAR